MGGGGGRGGGRRGGRRGCPAFGRRGDLLTPADEFLGDLVQDDAELPVLRRDGEPKGGHRQIKEGHRLRRQHDKVQGAEAIGDAQAVPAEEPDQIGAQTGGGQEQQEGEPVVPPPGRQDEDTGDHKAKGDPERRRHRAAHRKVHGHIQQPQKEEQPHDAPKQRLLPPPELLQPRVLLVGPGVPCQHLVFQFHRGPLLCPYSRTIVPHYGRDTKRTGVFTPVLFRPHLEE